MDAGLANRRAKGREPKDSLSEAGTAVMVYSTPQIKATIFAPSRPRIRMNSFA